MQVNKAKLIDERIRKAVVGFLLGFVCGPISILLIWGSYVGVYELATTGPDEGIDVAIGRAILLTIFYGYVWHLTAVQIGVIIGIVNGASNGGIDVVGIEWIFIIGIALTIGAWVWQIGPATNGFYIFFRLQGGLIGGLVGFLTWVMFRAKGARNRLTKLTLLGYLLAFTYVAIVGPISYIDIFGGLLD